MFCGAKASTRNKNNRLPAEEARARGRMEMSAAIMTFRNDVVEVQSRLTCLVKNTDAQYRKHRMMERDRRASLAASIGTGTGASAVGIDRATPNTILLPPLTTTSQYNEAPPQLAASTFGAIITGIAGIQENSYFDTQDGGGGGGGGVADDKEDEDGALANEHKEEDDEYGNTEVETEQTKERKKYERRMSLAVAAADPWNLAPLVKPRPARHGMTNMSFLSKPPAGLLPPLSLLGMGTSSKKNDALKDESSKSMTAKE